jgi:hypothetical protein
VDKKQIDIEKQNLLRDYRECFTTPAGKRVFFDLLKRCGTMDNNFHQEERTHCYLSGRGSIGHEINELMNYATIEGYYEFKKAQIEQAKAKSIVGTYFKRGD